MNDEDGSSSKCVSVGWEYFYQDCFEIRQSISPQKVQKSIVASEVSDRLQIVVKVEELMLSDG